MNDQPPKHTANTVDTQDWPRVPVDPALIPAGYRPLRVGLATGGDRIPFGDGSVGVLSSQAMGPRVILEKIEE